MTYLKLKELSAAISAQDTDDVVNDIHERLEYLISELSSSYDSIPHPETQYAVGDVINLLEFLQDNLNQL